MADRSPRRRSQASFYAAALLWLPAGLLVSAAVRFGPTAIAPGEGATAALMALPSLIVAAVCGLPLALACRRLGRLGRARAAWIGGAALGAATVAASLPAGLFGPPGVAIVAVVLSLPVWIAVLWLRRRARANAGVKSPPLDGQDRRP
ncbi:MAG: hypothetical protein OXK73_11160 [Rhodospirillaceae bacterium]|nr:hypothetical protein [Rhodospirillaceae bacterium]